MSDWHDPVGGHKTAAEGSSADRFAAFEQDMLVDLRALTLFSALCLRFLTATMKAACEKAPFLPSMKASCQGISKFRATETSPKTNSKGGT